MHGSKLPCWSEWSVCAVLSCYMQNIVASINGILFSYLFLPLNWLVFSHKGLSYGSEILHGVLTQKNYIWGETNLGYFVSFYLKMFQEKLPPPPRHVRQKMSVGGYGECGSRYSCKTCQNSTHSITMLCISSCIQGGPRDHEDYCLTKATWMGWDEGVRGEK